MRIVTLNTWKNEGEYERRLALMADGLLDLEPDVVCLQECFVGAGRDTAQVLAEAIGLEHHARPSRAKSRSHDGGMVQSTSGLAMLSRRPAFAEDALALPSLVQDGDRIAQRLDVMVDGQFLRVLNLHLTHLRGAGADEVRGRQLRAALVWAAVGWTEGLLVAGDLNAAAGDPELATLNVGSNVDFATLIGARSDTPPILARAIDHLVLQEPGSWRVASRFRALDMPDSDGWHASDHAAVVLDLEPDYSR
ncbi:endonuclease/exonuclease/phosphatase family protein [Phenylobacterium sp.]|uniref:endonuclease/exonuclease/phosphatase family protein n=1 Tax=Phenylobacterium sp. TaxID=1871053 RepID=UPI00286A9A49|nr:endonuclease/exonuclease/phosphatase family protein [Phenylobacterium sp.]